MFNFFAKKKQGSNLIINSSSTNEDIGMPKNFRSLIQIKHDKERNEYTGLPDEWSKLLNENNIKLIS